MKKDKGKKTKWMANTNLVDIGHASKLSNCKDWLHVSRAACSLIKANMSYRKRYSYVKHIFIRPYELIIWEYRLVQFSLAPIFFDQRFRFHLFSLRTRKSFYWNILHQGLSGWEFVWFDIPRKSPGHPYSAFTLKRRVLKKIPLKEPTVYWEEDR